MSKQTDDIVRRWSDSGLDDLIRERTGLRNDSFFTAAKAAWILETVPGARERAERGELALGTPETWLLWNLTGGRVHQTDPGCASRTAMFDIARGVWDEQLCDLFGVPMSMLAEVRPSNSWFGDVAAGVLPGRATRPVPIWAVLGDQQAGLFGQACLQPGDVKSTYGTAGVINVNIGQEPRMLDGLMTSIAWNIDGRIDYEVEGVVCHSGQTLHWLRDRLGIIDSLESTSALAAGVKDNGGAYFVPAFSGLWNPYWDRNVRGTIVGLTLETGREHVVRAAIESMAYQTRDVVDALVAGGVPVSSLRVDGGAASNEFLCQFQADILGVPVLRAHQLEQTAFGVAHLAGAGAGLWSSFDDVGARWRSDRIFEPALPEAQRAEVYEGWQLAVKAARSLPPRTTTHHTREELR